ncbi:MAG: hypothetical protein M1828_003582 [Chrysothrix sp. TS-e1954]|nr:MAG: hypothetical protein M1828_003582 [Chrysothrix sp. TS-e1954]
MDEPSAQLELDLRTSVTDSIHGRRPILHHLNADTSWFLQIPRPLAALRRGSRHYFNILIDPWLSGSQSDVASWFSQQWHAVESSTRSIAEVEELAREIEMLAEDSQSEAAQPESIKRVSTKDVRSYIDAVAISHEFTDHCHKDTLLELDRDVPVFASDKAASLIRSWKYFRSVKETPRFQGKGCDWRSASLDPLPNWISISRLATERDAFYYHSAVFIVFDNSTLDGRAMREDAEAVIYTPHGIYAPSLEAVTEADPPIKVLALLHGLHDVAVSKQQLNLGAHNGLEIQRLLNARYWISTHDEDKTAYGLVKWFLYRRVLTIGQALEEEKKRKGAYADEVSQLFDDTRHVELGNGESRVLAL